MTTEAENRLLTDVEPGAPMHQLWKEFWIPAIRSEQLEADGAPVRVRLLGENYVAFRATDGRVGFFDEYCPHRRASLVLARNENCSLRCIYHGWRFDVSGKCVETPNTPAEGFAGKVQLRHFPVRDVGGIVWVYLGAGEAPQFSGFEWTALPPEQVLVRSAIMECNWLQALEGSLDSSHASILHQNYAKKPGHSPSIGSLLSDIAPRFEVRDEAYGLSAAAIRSAPENRESIRITRWVAPSFAFVPHGMTEPQVCDFNAPIDSTHTLQWYAFFHPYRALTEEERTFLRHGTDADNNNFLQTIRTQELWGQDRAAMKAGSFTGFPGPIVEDVAVQESMGPIVDRSKEFLCSSDMFIVRARRWLLERAERAKSGGRAAGDLNAIDYPRIRSIHHAGQVTDASVWERAVEPKQAAAE